ncbi:hypothetical protein PYW08_002783 [Mythimna loreyi]|uniref:Uncharacterized protein n=1 Tax=Mythimna loreyi TaxID=667449 RepID=A0ACC2QMX5_9NEOP|nr:hypothetical protein PYW08_002783 [Mythimna loreyi]
MDLKPKLINTVKELKNAIEEGDIKKLKEQIDLFNQDLKRNEQLLCDLYKSGDKYVSQTELILTACRNKKPDVLYYLLNETEILDHFPGKDFSDPEVNSKRTEAFKLAIIWDSFPMVEMMYNYWSGDLHWIGHDINKIRTLGKLLKDARVVCKVENQQLLIDIHSLIKFNDFQQTLYSSISNIAPEKTVPMLIEMLQIYDKYSQLQMVRLPHQHQQQEQMIQAGIEDGSDYMKIQLSIKYEIYFRKLDLNVALLILENIHVLRKYFKQRFKEPESYYAKNSGVLSLYKQIESVIYNFIFRTYEDWRMYLPGNRQITREENHTGIDKGKINHNLVITYDQHKLFYGPVLFLERKNYYKRLSELKNILLEKHVISEDPENIEGRQSLLNENYLTSSMYMNGYYSLSRIVYYLKALEDTDNVNVLMIERVLQVIGEMLKNSDNSNHLLDSIKLLLHLAIPEKTVHNLCDISTFLSHADKRQLSKRIDIERKQAHVFGKIKQDLKIMRQVLDTILDFYMGILDKSFLEDGLHLLDERIKHLPNESSQHMDEVVRYFKIHEQQLMVSQALLQELMERTGLTTLCLKEIIWICVNIDGLLSKINTTHESTNKKFVRILTTYIQKIRKTIEPTDTNHKNVNSIDQDLVKCDLEKVSQNPKNEDISVKQVEDFSHYNTETISKMLSFFLDKCKLLLPKPQVNLHAFTERLLEDLEKQQEPSSSGKNLASEHSFESIEELHAIFQEHNPPEIEREQPISTFIYRVNQLKKLLGYPHFILEENLRRYQCNLQFRFELEMLLADISNVLNAHDIKSLMNKSGKLLRDIDLGSVLNHGNLFLEVLGDVFDSSDLPTALLSKAIKFVEDAEPIEALCLLQGNIDYETIKKGKLEAMTDEQVKLYKKIQKSSNWENYATLVCYSCENRK